MAKRILLSLMVVFIAGNISFLSAAQDESLLELIFFYSQACHACQKTKHEIMPLIEKGFAGRISIEYLDIADANNYKLLLGLEKLYGLPQGTIVPTVFIGDTALVGYEQIKEGINDTIQFNLQKGIRRKLLERLPGIDLAKRFLSFGTLAIIIAGLIDGINPCAFTVIVFFVSFLSLQGYKKKELFAIGLAFISAVFITYILVGLGVFRSLYALNKFYIVTKIIYYLIALSCFVLGILAVYDLWIFRKTGLAETMALKLPAVIKNRIHSIIGSYYRKSPQEKRASISERHLLRLTFSALVTGFLVSLLEAVCTGQLYLPTITFVLKESSLRMRAFGYLIIYNLMFIIPLFAVLALAMLGVVSRGFAAFMNKHMVAIKLSTAILFFGLGFFILLAT